MVGVSGTARPVGLLGAFGQFDAELRLDQRGVGKFPPTDEPRGEHGVENRVRHEPARPPQKPQVVIRAVEEDRLALERGVERFQRKVGERVDEGVLVVGQADLHEAKFLAVDVERIGLGVEGDAVGAVEMWQEGG